MTPEDAGIAAYHKSIDSALPATDLSHSMFIIGNAVYNAIRAAVEAEREACAQIADKEAEQWGTRLQTDDAYLEVAFNSEREARTIAAAIRARP